MRIPFILLSALIASGCVRLPEFETRTGVTPKSIIDVIECELIASRSSFAKLKTEKWTAVADLYLQVDEQATLSPTFAHTDVVSASLTRALDWGLKFDTQAQRVYTETVEFAIEKLRDPGGGCAKLAKGISLNGDLGLAEVIGNAFGSLDGPSDDGKDFRTDAKKGGSFGTTIQFVIIKNLNGGPTWTLSHFKGPGKLFSTQRTDTHKVSISFARGQGEKAAAAARESNYRLQQQTLPTSILNTIQNR